MVGGGSADKASKVRSLLASYYDMDDGGEAPSLHDTPRSAPSPTPSPAARGLGPALAGAARGAAGSPGSGGLNASYFDPDAYLKRLLKETRLAELTARQRDMAAEVSGLDSDMQMLVYENYSKFITATDTIKLMSGSMEGMDARMAQLRGLIDGVVASSEAVNGKLAARQAEMEELTAVRLLLHKLHAVFDLPRKLRAAIQREAFEVAADAYADGAPLLKKYGHKGAFKRVSGEVEACGRELAGILRRRLLAAPDQAAECIQMIAKLGEPTESLQEDFLECKRQRLEGLLAAAGLMLKTLAVEQGLLSPAELGAADEGLRQRMHAMFPAAAAPADGDGDAAAAGGGGGAGGLPSLHAVVVQLDGKFITEITHTAALFAELFPPGGRKRLVKMCRECFGRYLKLTRRALSDASAIAAAAAAGITAGGEQVQPLERLLGRADDGQEADRLAQHSVAEDWGAAKLLEGLYVVRTDLARLDSLLPELSPGDRGGELVEHTVRQHASLCFAALERRLLSTAAALGGALAGSGGEARKRAMARGLAALQGLLAGGLERLLRSLKEFERQRWVLAGWGDVFVSSVHGQVSNLFLSLGQQLLALGGVAPPAALGAAAPDHSARGAAEPAAPFAAVARRATPAAAGPAPPPALLLLLSRLCSYAEREAVGSALVLLQRLHPERALAGADDLPAFLPTELGRQLAAASAALLAGYVQAHGAQLAAAVAASSADTDWAGQGEPRAPRRVCDALLRLVADADEEAACLLDGHTHSRAASGGSAASWSGGGQAAHSRGGSRGAGLDAQGAYMEASVSRMLSAGRDRSGGAGGVEASRPGIAAALLAGALRALVGSLRRQTLGRCAFQQIQLDIHYLRPELQRLVSGSGDGPGVLQLLDELMAVALERCTEPLLLDSGVLDRLLVGSRQAAVAQVSLL